MNQPFAELLPGSAGGGRLRVWLKSSAYTKRLLLGEAGDPWVSAANYLAYFSQAHGLLKPDVAVLEVGEFYDAWTARHGGLAGQMGNRRRASTALRKLLEPQAPRAVLAEVVEAVLAHLRGQTPLVLAVPSPRHWLNHANRMSGRSDIAAEGDDIEDAAMYLADLIRAVSVFPVSGLLLEEAPDDVSFGPADLARYQSVVNVVRHYRWSVALRLPAEVTLPVDALADFDAVISPVMQQAGSAAVGRDISAAFARGDSVPPLGERQFHFAQLEAGLRPESVLEALSRLRGG
ncbi:hypothetical protein [Methylibium sp.]|uniref:hypothetical protein n=1 Tax=Methylibium sp. TaxID=2067992 RepID=UPI003D0BF962